MIHLKLLKGFCSFLYRLHTFCGVESYLRGRSFHPRDSTVLFKLAFQPLDFPVMIQMSLIVVTVKHVCT